MIDVAVTRVPGDKSISHRALLLAALAEGRSRLAGVLAGEDCAATAAALRALGVRVPPLPGDGSEFRITGRGLHGFHSPEHALECANSGTTARLLLGLLAGQPFSARLNGDESLRRRPMRRVTQPLERMGARFRELGEPDRLPLEITGGALSPLRYASPQASAQVKSAILLAGLTGGAAVEVCEPRRSRDHTERLLAAQGVPIRTATLEDGSACVALEPVDHLDPLDLEVPGDFSSAAFLLAFALLGGTPALRVRGVGVNPTRTGLLGVLERMGAQVAVERRVDRGGEPVADLVAGPAEMHGTDVLPQELPSLIDEVPVLAALAARAAGETRITGATELRYKESDRLAALAAGLRAVGVEAEELPDGIVVRGTDRPLRGRVRTHGDHRIAMTFGVLAALRGNDIGVDQPDVVAISYPGFWDALRSLQRPQRR